VISSNPVMPVGALVRARTEGDRAERESDFGLPADT
jgi:hypothetical protein